MNAGELAASLVEINRRLCVEVWNLGCEGRTPGSLSPRLIRPKKRDQTDRLSEQEARFLMTGVLGQLNFFYSVETPTKQEYSFTGQSKRGVSARTDLTLYWPSEKDGTLERLAAIEFKAGNPVQKDISKDIEKLVTEGLPGNWFHALDGCDKGTLKALIKKFKEGFKAKPTIGRIKPTLRILICICALPKKGAGKEEKTTKERRAWYREFRADAADSPEAYIDGFFDITCLDAWSTFRP